MCVSARHDYGMIVWRACATAAELAARVSQDVWARALNAQRYTNDVLVVLIVCMHQEHEPLRTDGQADLSDIRLGLRNSDRCWYTCVPPQPERMDAAWAGDSVHPFAIAILTHVVQLTHTVGSEPVQTKGKTAKKSYANWLRQEAQASLPPRPPGTPLITIGPTTTLGCDKICQEWKATIPTNLRVGGALGRWRGDINGVWTLTKARD